MNVTNNVLYAVGVIIVSLALIVFAVIVQDTGQRGTIIGALIGYWFREGVSITATAKQAQLKATDAPE
jgi:hypothetical protein